MNINRLFPKGSAWEAESVSTKHTFNGKAGGTRRLEVLKVIKGYVDLVRSDEDRPNVYSTLNTVDVPVFVSLDGRTVATRTPDLRSVVCIYRRVR